MQKISKSMHYPSDTFGFSVISNTPEGSLVNPPVVGSLVADPCTVPWLGVPVFCINCTPGAKFQGVVDTPVKGWDRGIDMTGNDWAGGCSTTGAGSDGGAGNEMLSDDETCVVRFIGVVSIVQEVTGVVAIVSEAVLPEEPEEGII